MSGTHKHRCRNCSNIWEHGNDKAGDREEHTCSKCGCEQWTRYYDSQSPVDEDHFLRALTRLIG